MVSRVMFQCASIILTVLLLLNVPSASTAKNSTKLQNRTRLSGRALQNHTTSVTHVYKYRREKLIETVMAYRKKVTVNGGFFNGVFSFVNLVLSIINFYLLFGKFPSQLLQVAAKLDIAVEELKKRDLHPKIKMGFARKILPNTPMLNEIMTLMKEPSPLFDGTNGLLEGQKEKRLEKLNQKLNQKQNQKQNQKEEKTSKAAKSEKVKSESEGEKKR